MALIEVLGFLASMSRSRILLNAMAALRQETMARTIRPKILQPGQAESPAEREPHIIPIIAKGRAKIECSNLIISR